MSEGWVKFPINIKLEKNNTGNYMRVWINKTEGISWRSIENLSFYRLVGEMGDDNKWQMQTGKAYRVSIGEPVEVIANCKPENVINGHSRILSADCYEWVSDPEQELPQWIEVEFRKAMDINMVSLVFDTDMTNPGTSRDIKIPNVPFCAKDYDVEIYDGYNWKKVAKITDNFMRKRNHSFETTVVKKIRVTVHSTCGDKSARITEIRASLEK
jgi:hypothetical protein